MKRFKVDPSAAPLLDTRPKRHDFGFANPDRNQMAFGVSIIVLWVVGFIAAING